MKKKLVHLEKENFKDLVKEGVTLVDFYVTWCGACKMLVSILEEISNDRAPFNIVKVDVDKHSELAREYGIMSVPTMYIIKDGEIKKTLIGFMPKDKIINEVNQIK